MGEEEKKTEEKKVEEVKKPEEKKEEQKNEKPEEKKEEKKTEESKEPPPPPEEIVLKVYMHCEGCAKKVRRCLKGFPGVEDVLTNCRTHNVVVKGKQADPLKVLERLQRKSHRKVELISPIPKPPAEDAKKEEKEKENVKPEEKKEEIPPVIIIVIKVHMHCEACALEIQKRIERMKGVQEAEPDLKASQVTVKGVFDPQKLVEYVYKKTGKHAVIVKQEPEKKEEKGKEEKEEKNGKKEKEGEGEKKEKKEGEEAKPTEVATEGEGEPNLVELKKNEFYYYPQYYPPKYHTEYPYAPQIFSDENPNACSVM